MHVLIIPSWYPTKDTPINGIFFKEQAEALCRSGLKVGVIAPSLRSLRELKHCGKKWPKGLEVEDVQGVMTYRFHGWAFLPKIPGGNERLFLNRGIELFDAYVRDHGMPDILHAHSALYGGVLACELKRKHGIPCVITEHCSIFARKLLSEKQKKACMGVFAKSDARIAVSVQFGNLLESMFGTAFENWKWIPNIVDSRFKCITPISLSPDFVFLNVAFLTPNKGQADLIEAFAIAFKGNKDVRLKIGGDGISMSTLIEKAEELGVSDQVVFMGMLSRDEVLREMQLCDCFVLSSHYETFGVVLVEALACGKPVVATACGGPECIVNEKNGYLVPVKDIHALAKTMLKIKSQIFSSNEISKECQECFGEESVVAKIKEVYGEVFRGRS